MRKHLQDAVTNLFVTAIRATNSPLRGELRVHHTQLRLPTISASEHDVTTPSLGQLRLHLFFQFLRPKIALGYVRQRPAQGWLWAGLGWLLVSLDSYQALGITWSSSGKLTDWQMKKRRYGLASAGFGWPFSYVAHSVFLLTGGAGSVPLAGSWHYWVLVFWTVGKSVIAKALGITRSGSVKLTDWQMN